MSVDYLPRFGIGFRVEADDILLTEQEDLCDLYELREYVDSLTEDNYTTFILNEGYDTEPTGLYLVFNDDVKALSDISIARCNLVATIKTLQLSIIGSFNLHGGLYTY